MSENKPNPNEIAPESETSSLPKKPKKKKRFKWKSTLIYFLLLFLLFRGASLKISPETTYITEPLTADGTRVDYFRAIELETYPPTMKTDGNGYRVIVRALGPGIDPATPDADLLARQVYEKLGLDPTVKPTMSYITPYDFLENYEEEQLEEASLEAETSDENNVAAREEDDEQEDLYDKVGRPWTLETLPMMADWLEPNSPTLDLVSKAVRQPEFGIPLVRINDKELLLWDLNQDSFARLGALARGFTARAYYRIGTGDLDGAIDDFLTCKILGRRVGQQVASQFYGPCTENVAQYIGIAGSLDHPPTEIQFQRLLDAMLSQEIPERVSLEKITRFSRFQQLDSFQSWAVLGSPTNSTPQTDFEKKLGNQMMKLTINWNRVMKRINLYYDDPAKGKQMHEDFQASIDSRFRIINHTFAIFLPSKRSDFLVDLLISLLDSSSVSIVDLFHRTGCSDNLQAITLAMLIYEKQHGRLPPAYTVDAEGKPLHSWRVLLLPYLGEGAKKLHEKIRLDEPWDSKHNRQFHDAVVKIYQCPGVKLEPGQTTYAVVVGEKNAFQPGEGKKLDQFGPNSVNLILVLEGYTPTCWMDPTSNFTEKTVLQIFNNPPQNGATVTGFRSGSVTQLRDNIPDEKFRQMLEGTAETVP